MTDVYKQLPRLSWRGIVVPVASRSATFSHDNVSHKFVYRDNELVEALGARNWTFSYTIPMREDIVRGPYLNLFTRTMPEFILACRDRTPGDLEDPVLGVFRARCTSLAGTSDVTRRDGDDLQVEFIHAPEIDDIDLLSGGAQDVRGAAEDARSLDDAVAAVDW